MYFSCIFDEHTYMDLPSIFSDKHCRYIARMYMCVLFEISINLHFIYVRWIYSHGSAKYICQQILYVYCMYILPRTFWNIHKCTFHVCSMNIRTWIWQVYLLADIVYVYCMYILWRVSFAARAQRPCRHKSVKSAGRAYPRCEISRGSNI